MASNYAYMLDCHASVFMLLVDLPRDWAILFRVGQVILFHVGCDLSSIGLTLYCVITKWWVPLILKGWGRDLTWSWVVSFW